MSSSWRVVIAVVMVAVAFSAGCIARIGEPVGGSATLQLGPDESGCLDGAGDVISNYFAGNADAEKVSAHWDCASRSLELFAARTRGATPGVYSGQELRVFLEKYFLQDFRISDLMLRESMILKQAILGGSPESLTFEEIYKIRLLLQAIKVESLRLLPYFPITSAHYQFKSKEVVDEAATMIEGAALRLGSMIEASGYPYFLDRLAVLMAELERVPPVDGKHIFGELRRSLSLFITFKGLVFGSGGDRIAGNEWTSLITTAARMHSLYFRFNHFSANFPDWLRGSGRERMVRLGRDAFALLDEAVGRHDAEVIRFVALDAVVDELGIGEALKLKSQTVKDFMRPALRRFLGGSRGGSDGRGANGLSRMALLRARLAFENWAESQHYLEMLFATMPPTPGDMTREYSAADLLAPKSNRFSAGHPGEGLDEHERRDPVAAVRAIIANSWPLFAGEAGAITFKPFSAPKMHSFHGLSMLNWMRVVTRLLIGGYAEDPARLSVGVTMAEFSTFVEDGRQLMIELKLLDPENLTTAERRFSEANLFTFAANGDSLVDEHEGAELLAFMISGKNLANRIHMDALGDAQCRSGEEDPFGYLTVDAPCYRRHFFANTDVYWSRMPVLRSYYSKLDARGTRKFQVDYENAARRLRYSDERNVDSTDSEAWGMIGHYVEAMFSRFDENGSGTLDAREAKKAFPVFYATVRDIFNKRIGRNPSRGEAEGLFTYLLAHGAPPTGAVSFAWWMAKRFSWSFEADPGRVVAIFSELGK